MIHSSHPVKQSAAKTFSVICPLCGETDRRDSGPGPLANPCSSRPLWFLADRVPEISDGDDAVNQTGDETA